jgi:hypothetical protein
MSLPCFVCPRPMNRVFPTPRRKSMRLSPFARSASRFAGSPARRASRASYARASEALRVERAEHVADGHRRSGWRRAGKLQMPGLR